MKIPLSRSEKTTGMSILRPPVARACDPVAGGALKPRPFHFAQAETPLRHCTSRPECVVAVHINSFDETYWMGGCPHKGVMS
jgi:hypothetical protein